MLLNLFAKCCQSWRPDYQIDQVCRRQVIKIGIDFVNLCQTSPKVWQSLPGVAEVWQVEIKPANTKVSIGKLCDEEVDNFDETIDFEAVQK